MTRWHRPAGPINVWKVFEGYEKLKDGTKKSVKFSVQDVPDTEERKQEVIDLMYTYFLDDEAMCKSLKLKYDPNGVDDFMAMWKYGINQGVTIGCYKLDSDENIRELIGANVVFMMTDETAKDFEKLRENFKSEDVKKLYDFMIELYKKADVLKTYNVDKYVSSISLCVNPDYRGQKIGYHILDARRDLGKKYGFELTSTMFTVPTSQRQAERAGFVESYSMDYVNAVDDKGNPLFPNIWSTCVKIMTRRLP